MSETRLESGALPIEALAEFADREGRRPRPIYLAHKWFARRLGSAFRALLVGAVTRKGDDFWRAYYVNADLTGLTVLDPFVGGGTSVVEAARLGATTLGIDVDPVACAVSRLELDAAQLPPLSDVLEKLRSSVGETILPFHRLSNGRGSPWTVVHHFWVQTVQCIECDTPFDAHPNYRLAFAPEGTRQWVICADCGEVLERERSAATVRCGCGHRTTIDRGTVEHGAARCPCCHHSEPLIEVGRRTKSPPTFRLFATEVIPSARERMATDMEERRFLRATSNDVQTYENAAKTLESQRGALKHWIPHWPITTRARSDDRLVAYGYTHYEQLFNARQLLHSALLAEAISRLDEPIRRVAAMAFSNHLVTNCMQAAYAVGWRRLVPLFSVRAFRHIPRPVELNPWLQGTGRGTFPNAMRKIERASTFAREPRELSRGGGFRRVRTRQSPDVHSLINGDSRKLSRVAAGSIDIVLTDPPYFDNIAYSELSEFYLPWLSLFGIVGSRSTVKRLVVRSLRSRRGSDEKTRAFVDGLSAVFQEIARVLKPNGIAVFTYRHSLGEAWTSLATAIGRAPLSVVQVFPMQGEAGIGPHAHSGATLWDAVLVLRKSTGPVRSEPLSLDEQQERAAEKHASRWELRLAKALPGRFKPVDVLNLRRACVVGSSLGLFRSKKGAVKRTLEDVITSMGKGGDQADADSEEAVDLELSA